MSLFIATQPIPGQGFCCALDEAAQRFEQLATTRLPLKRQLVTESGVRLIWHAAPSAFYGIEDQLHVEEADGRILGFTLLHGYCWKRKGNLLTAGELHAQLVASEGDSRSISNSVGGEFSILHAAPTGGLLAFNDHSNFEALYHVLKDGQFSVSNRANLVRSVHPGLRRNVRAYAQMPVANHRLFQQAHIEGVRSLQMGEHLRFENGDVHLDWVSPIRSDAGKDDAENREHLLQESIDEIQNALRIAVRYGQGQQLGLTGGRDSRLLLGFLVSMGLHREIEFFTTGDETHPDVICAKQIADKFGLKHRVLANAVNGKRGWSTEEILYRVAAHSHLCEGICSAYSLMGIDDLRPGVTIKGFQGELLRAYHDQPIDPAHFPEVSVVMRNHGHWDPMGVMRGEFMAELETEIRDELAAWVGGSIANDDVPNVYWISELMPKWQGPQREYSAGVHATLSPLNTPSFFKYAFTLSHPLRRTGYAYFHFLNRVCPELCSLPFAIYGWREELRAFDVPNEIFQPPVPASPSAPVHGHWQHSINDSPAMRNTFINLVKSRRDTPLFDYVDPDKMVRVLETQKFPITPLRNFWGFAAAFFALNDITLPFPRRHAVLNNWENSGKGPRLAYNAELKKQLTYRDGRFLMEEQAASPDAEAALPDGTANLASHIVYPEASEFKACIIYRNSEIVKGYAHCTTYPFCRLWLEALQGDQVVGRFQANLHKPALARQGLGDGKHAFEWEPMKAGLSMNARSVTLRLAECGVPVEEIKAE